MPCTFLTFSSPPPFPLSPVFDSPVPPFFPSPFRLCMPLGSCGYVRQNGFYGMRTYYGVTGRPNVLLATVARKLFVGQKVDNFCIRRYN